MSDLDLDLLRAWEPEPVAASPEVREHARARLEAAYDGASTDSRIPVRNQFAKRLAVAAVVVAVLVAGAIVWVQREAADRVSNIKTVAVPKDALGDGALGNGPVNILVVGTDTRTVAQEGGRRSDTMILLRIDGTSVRALWIPRDLITASGEVMSATFSRGPRALIDTIKAELGVTIDHYAEVSFDAFVRVVDAVGGVRMYVPGPLRDTPTGLNVDGPGCQVFDGRTALQWVRARHVELLENGVWSDALSSGGDLYRQIHQQEFVRALAIAVREKVSGDPEAAVRLVDALIPALTIDAGFSPAEIFGLARALVDVDPTTMSLRTVPVLVAPDQGRVELVHPAADDALAPFRGEAVPPAPDPGPATTLSTTPVHAC